MYKIQNPEISEATQGKAIEYEEYRNKEFFDKKDVMSESSKRDSYF